MAKKVTKPVRLPKNIVKRIDAYAEEQEISEADALRQLVRFGLDSEGMLTTRSAESMDLKTVLAMTLIFLTIELGVMLI